MDQPALVIAASSRVLFNAEGEHEAYEAGGVDAFLEASRRRGDILEPAIGFHILKRLVDTAAANGVKIDVVVVSRRDADSGVPILASLKHHGLAGVKGAFTGGSPDIVPYLEGFGVQLFLSRSDHDVQAAINAGIPAARLMGNPNGLPDPGGPFRLAFDGDAVLFSEDSELIFQEHGLDAFNSHEVDHAHLPLPDGPMAPFFRTLRAIEEKAGRQIFRTALVTARTSLAGERALRTLNSWGARVDEAILCGFTKKADMLRAFRPHIFFDDNLKHLELSGELVASGHVPWPSR